MPESEANSVRESHPTIFERSAVGRFRLTRSRPVGNMTGVGILSSPLTGDIGVTSSGRMMMTDGILGVPEPPSQPENGNHQLLVDALAFRDQLMGILGHDLRNPLSAITALARVTMQRDDLPADVRERLAQM